MISFHFAHENKKRDTEWYQIKQRFDGGIKNQNKKRSTCVTPQKLKKVLGRALKGDH